MRSVEGVFVGYPRNCKGYRVWVTSTRQIIHARDVKFLEKIQEKVRDDCVLDELFTSAEKSAESVDCDPKIVEFSPRPIVPENKVQAEELGRTPGRPQLMRTGSRGRPKKLFRSRSATAAQELENNVDNADNDVGDEVFAGIAEVSMEDALNGEAHDEWKDSMESEIISLIKNDTWDIFVKNDNKEIVGCRWVLTNKHGADGKVERRKSRLVAKGYSQKYGVNYHQTFAPVARLETLRLLLALAVQFGLKIWQFDVVTAYLNGSLNEEVIMRVPDLLNEMLERIVSKRGSSDVGVRAKKMLKSLHDGGNACKLKKALYGLKQAGRQWYSRLNEKLVSLGLKPTKNEPCLFYSDAGDDVFFVLIYVDDILVASSESERVINFKTRLLEDFEIKELGIAKYCLGLEIDQRKGQIMLSQTGYVLGLLKQYKMEACNPVATPSEVNVRFDNTDDYHSNEKYPYRELIGALMYLSVATRPDISNVMSRLAQFAAKPLKCHWIAAKRVLRYLAGTANIGLIYSKTDESLFGYTDADWGGCTVDRHSYTGYAFFLSGATITWKSQKQRTVALSSTEAEYVSLAEAAKEAIYLRSLLNELGLEDWTDTVIYVDNRGAQCLANDPVFHARTKHIDIKHHFVRESICAKKFSLEHVSTEQMIADILTKSLVRVSHQKCLEGLGLSSTKALNT